METELIAGKEYYTAKGLLEYTGEGLNFRVKGYRAQVVLQSMAQIYAPVGYSYYKCKERYVQLGMPHIREMTARHIGTHAEHYDYRGVLQSELAEIEFGTNDDPYSTPLYLIDKNGSAAGLVPEYFLHLEDAEAFLAEFEDVCKAEGMIGYTKEKDRKWKEALACRKKELQEELNHIQACMDAYREACEENMEKLMHAVNEPRLESFEQAKEWADNLIPYLNFYKEQEAEYLKGLTPMQQEQMRELAGEKEHEAKMYMEERRVYYSQSSNTESEETDRKLEHLEAQQKGMRMQILAKQNEATAREWELLNSKEPRTKEEIDRQIEQLEKLYQDMEKALDIADKYQKDIEKEVEEILKNVSPGIYKAWALGEMHYTDNRW